jgi:hypothetical protein
MVVFVAHPQRYRPAFLAAARVPLAAAGRGGRIVSSETAGAAAAVEAAPHVVVAPCPPADLADTARRVLRACAPAAPTAVLVDRALGVEAAALSRQSSLSGIPWFSPVVLELDLLRRALAPAAACSRTWLVWIPFEGRAAPTDTAYLLARLAYLAIPSPEVFIGVSGPAPPRGHLARLAEDARRVIMNRTGTPCHLVERVPPAIAGAIASALEGTRPPAPPGAAVLAYAPGGNDHVGGALHGPDVRPTLLVDATGFLEGYGPLPLRLRGDGPDGPDAAAAGAVLAATAGAVLAAVRSELPPGFRFLPPRRPLSAAALWDRESLLAPLAEALIFATGGESAAKLAWRFVRAPAATATWVAASAAYERRSAPRGKACRWSLGRRGFLTSFAAAAYNEGR